MDLLTDEERERLLANGRRGAHRAIDCYPVVKLYTPDAHATWVLAALDAHDEDTAFGLCDVGIGAPELGNIKLSDLAAIRGPRGQRVQRDPRFKPARSLGEYFARAVADGSVND